MAEGNPTLIETALGAFLHDTGKFWQRAYGGQQNADAEVRAMADQILPGGPHGRTHVHALWTWQFFHWMEKEGLNLPGADRSRVRNLAAYHHRPGGGPEAEAGAQWLIAEADQLAAGMDREARKDEDGEASGGWDQFIRTALVSPFAAVRLDSRLGEVRKTYVPLDRLSPEGLTDSVERVDTAGYQARYQQLLGRGPLAAVAVPEQPEIAVRALLACSAIVDERPAGRLAVRSQPGGGGDRLGAVSVA